MVSSIDILDLGVIITYLIVILVVGIAVGRGVKMTSGNYFLAGRNLNWRIIGAALFASNISTIHLVGLTSSGYNEGMVWGNFEWMASVMLIVLGLVFAPFYFKNKISTLPEFLEKRYGPESRSILAVIAVIGALFVHIGLSLYAGAVVFESFFGLDIISCIVVISILTAAYTVIGGLKAVVVTETIQAFLLIIGAAGLTYFTIMAFPDHGIDTWSEFVERLKPGQLKLLHSDESIAALGGNGSRTGLTWYACLLGYPILGLWYWCSDQTIVQRVLGAKTIEDARKGPIFAGFLKILPVFILVFPGVAGYALYKDVIGDHADQTLSVMISNVLPKGARGFMVAALMAALMSTVASAINSCSTLITLDIVKRLRPEITDAQEVWVGRVSAILVMILAILWSTQGDKFSSIFEAINKIASAIAPPVAAVFLYGVFSKKGTRKAGFVTLVLGLVIGIITFCLDFAPLSGKMYLTEELGIPFMMQAWWLFVICSAIYFMVSYITPPPSKEIIQAYTWNSPRAIIAHTGGKGLRDIRVWALILFLLIVILYSLDMSK